MRAQYLVILVTLCLPLQAGDPAEFDKAVEMFRSPQPAVRAQGARIADRELRRLLAPLLKAMEDPDPEVRRSVREVILGLVPYHDREPETAKERANRLQLAQAQALKAWRFQINKQVLIPRVNIQPVPHKALLDAINGQLVIQVGAQQRATAALKKFGVSGNLIQVPIAGLRVDQVVKGSAAEGAGLLKGDTILSVNGKPFTTHNVFLKALDPRRGWSGAKLKVMRGARIFDVSLK